MKYQLSFKLNEDDYYEFNRYHIRHTPRLRQQMRILHFVFPALLLVFAYVWGRTLETPYVAYGICSVIAVAWLALFGKICDWQMRKNIRRMGKGGRMVYDRQIRAEFGDDGFTEKTADSKGEYTYSMLTKVCAGRGGVYLYTGAVQAHIVPRSAFASDGAMAEFAAFVTGKLGK